MCCFKIFLTFTVALLWYMQIFLLFIPNSVNGISRATDNEENSQENDGLDPVANSLTGATKNPLTIFKENQSKFQRAASHLMYDTNGKCEAFTFDEPGGKVLHSPGWPNTYPNGTDCVRILEAPAGFILRLDFRDSFFIEPSDDCKFDFLEVRDGAHGFSKELGRFCGSDFPPILTSRDRHLWLHFHSDENIEYEGFTAVYEFIPRPTISVLDEESCRTTLSGFEGFINSTDIPDDQKRIVVEHKIAIDCMWTINVIEGWKIQLSFSDFKLERPNDCETNFIDIFDSKTDIPSRLNNFCGSIADVVTTKTNIAHIRYYAEAQAINSTFSILYTAYRDKPTGQSCDKDEWDCEDAKCLKYDMRCNDIINCQFRGDEEGCKVITHAQSEHITIIIVVFGLILGGMMITFLINCVRKVAKDQKLIREHIRQSRESELDAIDRKELKKSMQNLDRINGKTSLKSVEFNELSNLQRPESSKRREADEEPEEPHHYDEPPLQNEEIIINHYSHQVYPKPSSETKMCDSGVQTRESLFQNIYLVKAPSSNKSSTPSELRLSSFGYPPAPTPPTVATVSTQSIQTMEPNRWNESRVQQQHQQQQQPPQQQPHHHHHHSHGRDRYPVERYPSNYSSHHEGERKSAPDVIIVTNSISTMKR